MPANTSVTITATTTASPIVSASYTLTLVNPVPGVVSANPTHASAGGTISMVLTGTGFVSGTVLTASSGTVTTTYNSPTSITAQVTLPANASGNLSLAAQNPTPGGGTGVALALPIAGLTMTATNSDGTNTGTARLGAPVNLTTSVVNGAISTRVWTLQGAGTLTTSVTNNNAYAVYTPPSAMPANTSVTITATTTASPIVSTSYTLTLLNPVPMVSSATPAQLLAGGSQAVTLTGSGFMPGTTVSFAGQTLPIGYVSYNQATVQIPVANNATGTLSLQVQNPAPGGGAGTTFTESVQPNSITLTATGPDGINTGFGDIDFSVAMSAAVTGSAQTAVNWSVAGAGSISSAGVYTPPGVMPANPAVTIQAALASNPAITASYALTLVNPVPVGAQRLLEPGVGRRDGFSCLDRDRVCIRNSLDGQLRHGYDDL